MCAAEEGQEGHTIGLLARAWEILVARAREGRTITYGEMATAMLLSPQSTQFTDTAKMNFLVRRMRQDEAYSASSLSDSVRAHPASAFSGWLVSWGNSSTTKNSSFARKLSA